MNIDEYLDKELQSNVIRYTYLSIVKYKIKFKQVNSQYYYRQKKRLV